MEVVENLRNETSWSKWTIPYEQNCVYSIPAECQTIDLSFYLRGSGFRGGFKTTIKTTGGYALDIVSTGGFGTSAKTSSGFSGGFKTTSG